MKTLEVLDRIRKIDRLIRKESTGTPEELAIKIDLSVSRLYDMIREMKGMGAPIKYDKRLKTYFYKEDVSLLCTIKWYKEQEPG